MVLRRLFAFSNFILLCLLMSVHTMVSAQQSSWKTKNVALDCKDSSMTQALEQLAAQSGVSILAEGVPAQKPFTLREKGNAEKLLTQITDTYDYAWHVSKSGVVLLTRRFTDEHETPEINAAEIHASVQDVLGILRTIYTPPAQNMSLVDVFRQFAAQLSPEEVSSLKSVKGLSIATLSPRLRNQAANVIYFNELLTIYSQLEYFDRVTQALSTSILTTQEVRFNNGTVSRYVRLIPPQSETLTPFILWDRNDKLEEAPVVEHIAADTTTRADPALRKASTVAQLFALLQDRFHITATISPKMQDKRILLLMQDADVKRALPALAELENWVAQQKDGSTNDAFFVHRQSVNIPADARDMRQPILQALPPDVARCFYTKPKTVSDKPYQDLHDLFPQLPAGDPRDFVVGKMTAQQKAAETKLRRSFEQETFARPIPYSSLTTEQKQLVTQILFNHMGYQVADRLWEFLYKPASYVTNPINTRMIATGNGFIVIGAGGGRFEAREGVPVR